MCTIEIKKINKKDQALWNQIGKEAYKNEPDFQQGNILWPDIETVEDAKQFLYLIAFYDKRPVGRCLVKSSKKMNASVLLDICVSPEYRHKSIGIKLIRQAEDVSKKWSKDCFRIMSDIDDEDLQLLPFFIKAGFNFSDGHSIVINTIKEKTVKTTTKCKNLEKNGFKLRFLEKDNLRDLKIAVEMHKKYFPTFPGFMSCEDAIKCLFDKDFIFLVYEKEGEAAGIVVGKENTTTHHYRHIQKQGIGLLTSIAVCEKYRGQGLATGLVVALSDEVKKRGCGKLLYGGVAMGGASMRLAIGLGGEKIVNHIMLSKDI